MYVQGSSQGVYFQSVRRFFPEGVLGLMPDEHQAGRDGKMKSTLRSKVIRANVRDVKPRRHCARRSCLDLSRGLLLTFNGPILRRVDRRLKLIAVCPVAVKTVATLPVVGFTRGENLIEAT